MQGEIASPPSHYPHGAFSSCCKAIYRQRLGITRSSDRVIMRVPDVELSGVANEATEVEQRSPRGP